MSSENSLSFVRFWDVFLADVEHFKANVFAFFVTVKPKNKEITVFRDDLEVLRHGTRVLIALPHSGGIKEDLWVLSSVLEFKGEVSVVDVSGNRRHLEVRRIAFEMASESVDWNSLSWANSFHKIISAQSLSNRQGD